VQRGRKNVGVISLLFSNINELQGVIGAKPERTQRTRDKEQRRNDEQRGIGSDEEKRGQDDCAGGIREDKHWFKGKSTNERRSKWLNRDIAGEQGHDHRASHGGRPAEGDLEQQRKHEWNRGNYQPIDTAGRIANAKRWNTQHAEVKNSAWGSQPPDDKRGDNDSDADQNSRD